MNSTQFCYEYAVGSCIKPSRSTVSRMVLYSSCVLLMLVTIMGNLAVVMTVSHFKVLHSPTNFLSLSLAVADFFIGMIVLPFSSIKSVDGCWYFGKIFCTVHSGFDMCLCLTSIFHLSCISVDRYYAICDPLLYPTKFTVPVAVCFITVCWILAVVYSYGLLFSSTIEDKMEKLVQELPCFGSCQPAFMRLWGWLNFSIFFIPCVLMLGLYLRIFLVAMKQSKMINVMSANSQCLKNSGSAKREQKAAKTLGIAVGVYLLCWLPFIIHTTLDTYFNFITPPLLADVFNWLTYINSACNPIIYGFFYPWFRKALKLIVTGEIFCQGSSTINLYQKK
ncbi:trace amine-associated receptor 5-like [Protopterus annectens]|uniref:trace amine-associated receptor 5-like n=1 Tax=Protopterus annectens TaxID=7888 RepID=UPI001CF9FAF8|nr:trace amine-associated receptor 5-like [Protopterus annectens]